jgi:hypothetical protein
MEATSGGDSLDALEPLVGNWSMVPTFEGMPPADTGAPVSFEWLSGRHFLIERWEVPVPEAPDGIAIIGADPDTRSAHRTPTPCRSSSPTAGPARSSSS